MSLVSVEAEQLMETRAMKPVAHAGTKVSTAIHDAVLAGGEPTRRIADFLHGTWLGHPLHPVLTDFTIGAWVMGAAFDAVGAATDSDAMRRTADQLTAAGMISAVPTAITGLADYSTFPEPAATPVTLHAATNIVNFALYALSVRDRRNGNRPRGVVLSTIGLALTCFSAWLGGELVYRYQVGVKRSEEFDGPRTWKPVMAAEDLPQRKPKRIEVDGKGVLLYRDGRSIYALGAVCSHATGPLDEGEVQGTCVTCPWHQSVFDLRDGGVVHGPATQPQPAFKTRVRDGQVEIRLQHS